MPCYGLRLPFPAGKSETQPRLFIPPAGICRQYLYFFANGGFLVAHKYNDFTAALREAKHKSMLTLQDIADGAGLSISVTRKMFSGEAVSPSVYNVAAICKLLGVSMDDMFGLSAPETDDNAALRQELEHCRSALHGRVEQVNQLRRFVYVLVGVLGFTLVILAYIVIDALHPDWGLFRR